MIKYYFVKPNGEKCLIEFNSLEKAQIHQVKGSLYEDCTIATREVPSMKLGDFVENYEGDIDVYDDYDESLGVAFCGGDVKLTKAGKEHFAEIMGLDVEVYDACAIVNVCDLIDADHDPDVDPDVPVFKLVKELFYTFAGYCSEEKYEKYVKEIW